MRGSTLVGPMAYTAPLVAVHRTVEYRVSAALQALSSGASSTRIASRNPASSNARFHSRIPART